MNSDKDQQLSGNQAPVTGVAVPPSVPVGTQPVSLYSNLTSQQAEIQQPASTAVAVSEPSVSYPEQPQQPYAVGVDTPVAVSTVAVSPPASSDIPWWFYIVLAVTGIVFVGSVGLFFMAEKTSRIPLPPSEMQENGESLPLPVDVLPSKQTAISTPTPTIISEEFILEQMTKVSSSVSIADMVEDVELTDFTPLSQGISELDVFFEFSQ